MPDFLIQLHEQLIDPDRIPVAIGAIFLVMIAGAITGPMHGNANPFTWLVFDKIFGSFGQKINKRERPQGDLVFRGLVLTILCVLAGYGLGYWLEYLSKLYPYYNGVEVISLSLFITLGTVWYALLRLYFALEKPGDLVEGAYLAISRSYRANLNASDDFGITRLGINFAAKSFDKGLVSPVFWYLIAGLPALGIYMALSVLSWRFARDGQDKGFAQVPVALEKLLGFVPSMFAAVILTAASAIAPTAKIGGSLASWFGMRDRAAYAQGGFPLSSMAWALNLSIGGPYQDLEGTAVKAPWVGPAKATAKNDYKHLRRALIIHVICIALFIVSLASAYLWASI